MYDLNVILESIPTNDCQDRLQAKDDVRYSISMNSEVALRNFLSIWALTTDSDLANLSTSDKQYRLFVKEFSEKYHEHCQL